MIPIFEEVNPSVDISSYAVDSEIGRIIASYWDEKLIRLEFSDSEEELAIVSRGSNAVHDELTDQLNAYFKGELRVFDIPIVPAGTGFQKTIWQLLQTIPYGETLSYHDLAKQYEDEKSIRAIASANGANPIMIIIPCHRVVGSDGSLTGYAGGLWRKEALLDIERGIQRLF